MQEPDSMEIPDSKSEFVAALRAFARTGKIQGQSYHGMRTDVAVAQFLASWLKADDTIPEEHDGVAWTYRLDQLTVEAFNSWRVEPKWSAYRDAFRISTGRGMQWSQIPELDTLTASAEDAIMRHGLATLLGEIAGQSWLSERLTARYMARNRALDVEWRYFVTSAWPVVRKMIDDEKVHAVMVGSAGLVDIETRVGLARYQVELSDAFGSSLTYTCAESDDSRAHSFGLTSVNGDLLTLLPIVHKATAAIATGDFKLKAKKPKKGS